MERIFDGQKKLFHHNKHYTWATSAYEAAEKFGCKSTDVAVCIFPDQVNPDYIIK